MLVIQRGTLYGRGIFVENWQNRGIFTLYLPLEKKNSPFFRSNLKKLLFWEFFKVKLKLTHKILYFPLEFIEKKLQNREILRSF